MFMYIIVYYNDSLIINWDSCCRRKLLAAAGCWSFYNHFTTQHHIKKIKNILFRNSFGS